MKINYSFKLLIALFLLANLDIVGAAEDESGLSAAQALVNLRFAGRYLEPHLSSDHVSIQAEETDGDSEDEGRDLKGRFQCDECKKTFISNFSLKRHKIIHTGEKPYKCDQCGKSFTQSSNLKTHERVHAGEKSYQCDRCEKSFTRNTNLKIHQKIHAKQASQVQEDDHE